MTDIDPEVEADEPPIGQATIVYLGPTAPHWEIRAVYGERDVMDGFRDPGQRPPAPPAASRPPVPPQPRAGQPRRRT